MFMEVVDRSFAPLLWNDLPSTAVELFRCSTAPPSRSLSQVASSSAMSTTTRSSLAHQNRSPSSIVTSSCV
ncbi:ATP-binding cassette sub-family B member 7, mitochondrial [Sesbania bispinosa]|nr:ATP-binding cassette sub-family B member 7, mitochondrial [Sesbania bispinosa]